MYSFFANSFTAGVTVDVVVMMATDASGPVWVDREAQLAADAEEEC
jgi:hypothetical protein